jgi:hypothetical protein
MKPLLVLFASLVFPMFASAQSGQYELKTLLQDASYVFNRFDETTTGLSTQIDEWNLPESSKSLFKRELSAVVMNVNTEKPKLNALLLKNDVSVGDLFDVYSEVTDVSAELSGQSSNFSIWAKDSSKAIELAQLGAKANVLAAKIGFVLRMKIQVQEDQMQACSNKQTSPPASHK